MSLLKCRPVVLGESTESSFEMLMTDMRSIDRERAVKQREKKTEEKKEQKKKDEKRNGLTLLVVFP